MHWICILEVKTLNPRQKGRHLQDDIFKYIFVNENIRILLKISLKFVPKVLISNIPALAQIMVLCQQGNKPLSETIVVTYWCIFVSLSLKELTPIKSNGDRCQNLTSHAICSLVSHIKIPMIHHEWLITVLVNSNSMKAIYHYAKLAVWSYDQFSWAIVIYSLMVFLFTKLYHILLEHYYRTVEENQVISVKKDFTEASDLKELANLVLI